MLTVMSVSPIISVLLTSLLKRPVKAAAAGLARMSKASMAKVSRSLNTVRWARRWRLRVPCWGAQAVCVSVPVRGA
jgi:hypothetical protein